MASGGWLGTDQPRCGSVRISETSSVRRTLWPLCSGSENSAAHLPASRKPPPRDQTNPNPHTWPAAPFPGQTQGRRRSPPRHPRVAPARGPQLPQQPRVTAQGRQTRSKAAKIKTHRIPRTSGHTQSSLPERRSRGPPGAGPQPRPDPGGHGAGGGRARGGGPGLAASSRAPPRGSPARQPPRSRPRGRDLRTG